MESVEDTVLGEWVYCGQHLRAHPTGWCTVGNEWKVGIGPMTGTVEEKCLKAHEKCRRLGLKLYGDSMARSKT